MTESQQVLTAVPLPITGMALEQLHLSVQRCAELRARHHTALQQLRLASHANDRRACERALFELYQDAAALSGLEGVGPALAMLSTEQDVAWEASRRDGVQA